MILTIDVGNSIVTFGGFEGDELVFTARLSTGTARTEDEYASALASLLALRGVDKASITGAILSSVVPAAGAVIKRGVALLCGVEPLTVGPGIKTGLGIHCDDPASVGADLICTSVAAAKLYGSPCLIVDMGTATKITVVNEAGAFIGVSILPGVAMGLEALAGGAAQLPHVSLEAPPRVIGKNTADCMRSGVIYGHAAAVDGMIDRVLGEFGKPLPVYATGGLAPVILPHLSHEVTHDQHLVLRGLNLLYHKNT